MLIQSASSTLFVRLDWGSSPISTDKPYTHDIFLEQGFRHEIGVPDGFYPREWMRSKIRRKDDSSSSAPRRRSDVGDEFRRKKVGEVLTKKEKMMQDNLKSSRSDL
eukprot:scaffold37268_cov23-Cyclotella_meneghiniana.AAC.3